VETPQLGVSMCLGGRVCRRADPSEPVLLWCGPNRAFGVEC
jgi:hypothetical protein